MHKKKNIKFKIITGASAAGAVIVISVAVIIVLGQSKSQKYGVHLESANQYLVKEGYAGGRERISADDQDLSGESRSISGTGQHVHQRGRL